MTVSVLVPWRTTGGRSTSWRRGSPPRSATGTPAPPTAGSVISRTRGRSGGTRPSGWSTGRPPWAAGPPAMRGRTALYGPRHLLQLVAVKRRQAQGRRIAEIQQELTGAGEAALRAIAELPDALLDPTVELAAGGEQAAVTSTRPARFWTERPAPPPPPDAPAADHPGPALLTGVPLGGGAVLLLPAAPDHDDLSAITAAAGPLLDLLSARGLLRSAP